MDTFLEARIDMRLNIPTPCTQDWDAMTPAGPGRHCAACQKVVVDFSRMTDGEIVSWMQARAGQEICGRLETGQLGRELVPALPITRSQPWWSWARVSAAAGALWLVLAGGDADAQSRTIRKNPRSTQVKRLSDSKEPVPMAMKARHRSIDSTLHDLYFMGDVYIGIGIRHIIKPTFPKPEADPVNLHGTPAERKE